MSSVGSSSVSSRNNILFLKPEVRADPEEVREALSKALANCGSTLGNVLDLDKIEKEAEEKERQAGEKFMSHRIRMHEMGEEEEEPDDQQGEGEGEGEEDQEAARLAALSFVEEVR